MGKSGNRLIRFKEFTVRDDRCAMKIGTDALLLGAWCEVAHSQLILDIGSGSGIVSLMLAQRAQNAQIFGVELDPSAYGQCCENFRVSPFAERMNCHHESIQVFSLQERMAHAFDTIVSNPPFFHDKPKSPDMARNLARHDDSLPLIELLDASLCCLKPSGKIVLIWPNQRREELMKEADSRRLYLIREMVIHGSPRHDSTRFLSEWSLEPQEVIVRERLNILEDTNASEGPVFSVMYKKLLKPFVVAFE